MMSKKPRGRESELRAHAAESTRTKPGGTGHAPAADETEDNDRPLSPALRHRLASRIAGNWDREREELLDALLDCVSALRAIPRGDGERPASEAAALCLVDVVTSVYKMAALDWLRGDLEDDDEDDDY